MRDGHVWTACCLTSITRHTLTRTSAINGILAMMAFKKQFATNCGSPVEPEICPKDLSIIVAILSAGTSWRPRGMRYADELVRLDVMMLMTDAARRPIVMDSWYAQTRVPRIHLGAISD